MAEFQTFYSQTNLTQQIINRPRSTSELKKEEEGGHAVILMSYDFDHLRFLNSWGKDWGDKGFFKISDANVLG
jgi:C1A family cysteine protease